jgi:hypothetical protein
MERTLRGKRNRRSRGEQKDGSLVMPRPGQTNVVAGIDAGAIVPIQSVVLDGPGSELEGVGRDEDFAELEHFPLDHLNRKSRRSPDSKDAFARKESGMVSPITAEQEIASVQAPALPFAQKDKVFWDSEEFPRSPKPWKGRRR